MLSGCIGTTKEETQIAKAACEKVTDQNWGPLPGNNTGSSAQAYCVDNLEDIVKWQADELHPCMFGGFPFICVMHPNGAINIRRPDCYARCEVIDIARENTPTLAGHLVIIQ